MESTNGSHGLLLFLCCHHYLHDLLEVLGFGDSTFEVYVSEIVLDGNLLAFVNILQDLLRALLNVFR